MKFVQPPSRHANPPNSADQIFQITTTTVQPHYFPQEPVASAPPIRVEEPSALPIFQPNYFPPASVSSPPPQSLPSPAPAASAPPLRQPTTYLPSHIFSVEPPSSPSPASATAAKPPISPIMSAASPQKPPPPFTPNKLPSENSKARLSSPPAAQQPPPHVAKQTGAVPPPRPLDRIAYGPFRILNERIPGYFQAWISSLMFAPADLYVVPFLKHSKS